MVPQVTLKNITSDKEILKVNIRFSARTPKSKDQNDERSGRNESDGRNQ